MTVISLFKIEMVAAKGVQLSQLKFVAEIVKPSDKSDDEIRKKTFSIKF